MRSSIARSVGHVYWIHSSLPSAARTLPALTKPRQLARVPRFSTTSSSAFPESKTRTPPKHTNPGELPIASFQSLGATRSVKIVLIIALSILGTAETLFYVRAALRWWRGDESSLNQNLVDAEGAAEVTREVDVMETFSKGGSS
jgi:hypothetical protein